MKLCLIYQLHSLSPIASRVVRMCERSFPCTNTKELFTRESFLIELFIDNTGILVFYSIPHIVFVFQTQEVELIIFWLTGFPFSTDSSENYIKTKTFEGLCALHLAVSQGHWKITQILLEAGADPNVTTLEETTPLFLGDVCYFWYRCAFRNIFLSKLL